MRPWLEFNPSLERVFNIDVIKEFQRVSKELYYLFSNLSVVYFIKPSSLFISSFSHQSCDSRLSNLEISLVFLNADEVKPFYLSVDSR